MSVKGAEITGASVCGGTVSYQLAENKKQNFGPNGVKNMKSVLLLPLWCVWIPIIYDVNRPLVSSLKQPINASS